MKKNNIINFIIILVQVLSFYVIFVRKEIIPFGNLYKTIFEFLIITNSYLFLKYNWKDKDKVFCNKKMFILFLFLNLIISFFIGGKQLFLTNGIIDLSIKSLICYFLLNIVVFPIIYNILYYMDFINIKDNLTNNRTKKDIYLFSILIFLICFISWGVVALSFYPGNMTSDTIDELSQAVGLYSIVDSHPAVYTIIMRFVLKIWNSPMSIIMLNILCLSILISYIYTYLYKNGVKKCLLIILSFMFAFSFNNLILMTILWKDIPFTISLLWLTFEVYKISKEKELYFKPFNMIKIIIALLLVYFLRVNGMFPYILIIMYMVYLFFKTKRNKKILLTVVLSLLSIWIIKNPVYKIFKVESNSISSGAASFAAKGLGSLAYYNVKLPKEDYNKITKLQSYEILKENYSPYNIDTYSFGEDRLDYSSLTSSELYSLYIKYFFKYPNIIIRDRLDSNNLLWSYITPNDGFNSMYVVGIWYPSNYNASLLGLKQNDDGVYIAKSNIISKIVLKLIRFSENNIITYIIFWRAAFPLTMLLILIYWLINKKKYLFPMMFPILINIAFWVMLMSHQSYRYVWFIFLNTFILYLLSFLEVNKIKK